MAEVDTDGLSKSLSEAIDGEVRFDAQARALYSTDASNYRQVPIGVVVPRSLDDVQRAVALCRRFDAPVLSRGGGTSLAGQCCNVAVVIDFSKYLNRVLEIDANEASAWVEPGCVLDDLRHAAEKHGLTFGPDPATHDHNTLGGMIGNNSCGVHSVMAGRTVDNILALDVLAYDGTRMTVGPTDDAAYDQIVSEGGRPGEIYRSLRDIRDAHAERIGSGYPQIPRRVSGFNLDALLPENGFDVGRALVGTEGTCVVVLRAKCRLVPHRPERVLLILGFENVYASGDTAAEARAAGAIGIEGIDDKLIGYMRAKQMREDELRLLPEGDSFLLVEFGADDRAEAEAEAKTFQHDIAERCVSTALYTEPNAQQALWKVREAGLGATVHVPGQGETRPGWEDAAVPPEKVGHYLRDFRALLDRYGYDCSLYGHFGDGCIHCRIDFDFATRSGVDHYLNFIAEAADLVVSYGGSISGEHGDGQARGALLERMYGDELTAAFRDFKRIWDPDLRMNPGKVVDPLPPDADLREGPDDTPWSPPTRMAFGEDDNDFAATAARCVGVGKCRKHDSGVMCPSYMASRRESFSTRGRARLLFEMTRGNVIDDGWRSKAVHEALDFCLACKACKSECPVNVDMAAYKAEFMHHHYRRRPRPRAHYSMGLIWWWARAAGMAPMLANAAMRIPPIAGPAKWLGGIAQARDIPAMAKPTFRAWFARRNPPSAAGSAERRVLVWPDTFNAYFTPEPLQAMARLLEQAGWRPEIPDRPLCCGRPLYAPGMLGLAERLWRRTLAALEPFIRDEIPIVGLEPACVSAFRDELLRMFPHDRDAQRLARQVFHLSEFLQETGFEPHLREGRAVVHAHCHHRAVLGTEPELALLEKAGLNAELLDSGCCGMAGDYGFRIEGYDLAMTVAESRFLPSVRDTKSDSLVCDGFSCREQAFQATGRRLPTLPEVLLDA